MKLPVDPVRNLVELIRCRSVTPEEGGALAALAVMLEPMGFAVDRPLFRDDGTPDVENLYARRSGNGPHLMFAGHTDVVPPGDPAAWTHPPFEGVIDGAMLHGRGAVDMKGGIACFIAAVAREIEAGRAPSGSVSLLITGDEEGPAINGTVKLLQWAAARGEAWDAAIVGEPTNPEALGDMVKIGRRGSLSGKLTVHGVQGHAAYPHLADNAARSIVQLAEALLARPIDQGSADFQPSNLEITTIDIANPAGNVVPGKAALNFNIRFNDLWNAETLKTEIGQRLDEAAASSRLRPHNREPIRFDLDWNRNPSPVFLTRDERLTGTVARSIAAVTGRQPQLSTSGGTSDARFIKDYCPVVEFGLVGKTMHMANECVPLDELEQLTRIYQQFLRDWFE